MSGLLFLLLPLAIGAYAAIRIRAQLHDVELHWRYAGEQLGLTCLRSRWSTYPRLEGEVRGLPVTVTTKGRLGVRRGWAWELESRQQVDTVIEVELRFALPGGLALRPQGFLDSLAIAVGAQDVTTGDAHFDQLTRVRADDAAAVRALLAGEALRSRLLALWQVLPRAEVADRKVRAKLQGAEHHGPQLAAQVLTLVELAEALREGQRAARRAG